MVSRPIFNEYNRKWADRVIGAKGRRGIDGFLGLIITEIEPGRITVEMEVTDQLVTMMGTMHGGCLSALTDHTLGTIMYPVMPEGSWAATTEFKINLLAPVTRGICTARGEIISMTKRQAVVRIEVENEDRLVAVAQGTCTIAAPKPKG